MNASIKKYNQFGSLVLRPGGILKGERRHERELVFTPLSRLLWVLSCRDKKVPPPAGTGSRSFVERVPVKA